MVKEDRPYNFFSLAFHKFFLSKVLLPRLHLRKKEEEYRILMTRVPAPPFANHLPIEYMLLLAISAILTAIGLPHLLKRGSVFGLIVGGLGIAGFVALFVMSILSERGSRYSFESFRPSIFFFFVVFGFTGGLSIGFIYKSLSLGITSGMFGLLGGYSLGIFAGVWINYLGWIKALLIPISIVAIAGMVVVNLLFLFDLIF